MNTTIRVLSGLLVVLACLIALDLVRLPWLAEDDRQPPGVVDAEKTSRDESERAAEMEVRHRLILERIEAKVEVARLVATGRLDLFEAAARFKYLNETPESCQDDYRSKWPGNSAEEKVCRQVIAFVEREGRVGLSPSEIADVVCELEEQLAEQLAQNHRVELPQL